MELGIDIGELDQVIQIGGLNSSGSFLQRVGRHILAHQVICLCLQKMGATAEQIWNILSKASCFSKITPHDFDTLIRNMINEDFLRRVDEKTLMISDKTEQEFLRANWKRLFAIFDTGPIYNVVDGKKVIGTLDSGFARSRELPFIFVLGGQEWYATKIDHQAQQVLVKRNETGIPPKWIAMGYGDIPFELAQEIGAILMSENNLEFLDPEAKEMLRVERNTYCNLNWQYNNWILDVSVESNRLYLWTFSGDRINRTLSNLVSLETGFDITYDYMKLIVGTETEKESVSIIENTLRSLRSKTGTDLENMVVDRIKVKWISKFSPCLPDSLARKAICEKGMDIAGLVRELGKTSIHSI